LFLAEAGTGKDWLVQRAIRGVAHREPATADIPQVNSEKSEPCEMIVNRAR